MTDNITLPRKHIDYAAHALEHFNKDAPDPLVSEIIHHLRTALAAEQQKPEPVAWLSRDEARLALWKAINSREFGNPTDDKLILDHLRQQGLWIGKVTSPVPPEDEALRRDAERLKDAMRKAMAMLDKHEPEPAGAFAVLLLALNPELQSAKNAALRRED